MQTAAVPQYVRNAAVSGSLESWASEFPELTAEEIAFYSKEYRGVFCGRVQPPGCCDGQNPIICNGRSCGNDKASVRSAKEGLAWTSIILQVIGTVFFAIWIGQKIDDLKFVPIITEGEAEFTKGISYFLIPLIAAWAVTLSYYVVDYHTGYRAICIIQIILSGLALICAMALATASLDTLTIAISTGGLVACLIGLLACHIMRENLSPVVEKQRDPDQVRQALRQLSNEKKGTGAVRHVYI
jgi:hypothetical protein